MIEHIFDPANNLSAVSVRVDPGHIYLGKTNFIEPRNVSDLELSPLQASLLILALQKAVACEFELAKAWEESGGIQDDDEFL